MDGTQDRGRDLSLLAYISTGAPNRANDCFDQQQDLSPGPTSSDAVSCVVVAFPDGHRHGLWVSGRMDIFGRVLFCVVHGIYLGL